MTNFRLIWEQKGGHFHVTVFSANHPRLSHAKNGNLVFIESEWKSFLRCFQDKGEDTTEILPKDLAP